MRKLEAWFPYTLKCIRENPWIRIAYPWQTASKHFRDHKDEKGWRVAHTSRNYHVYILTRGPIAYRLVRIIRALLSFRYLPKAFLYDLGFLDTPEAARFSYRHWTWNPVATWRRRRAAGWPIHSVALDILRIT